MQEDKREFHLSNGQTVFLTQDEINLLKYHNENLVEAANKLKEQFPFELENKDIDEIVVERYFQNNKGES